MILRLRQHFGIGYPYRLWTQARGDYGVSESGSTLKHGQIESPAVGDEFELEVRVLKSFEERLEELEKKVSEFS